MRAAGEGRAPRFGEFERRQVAWAIRCMRLRDAMGSVSGNGLFLEDCCDARRFPLGAGDTAKHTLASVL